MKKKQLRQENEALRKRVAELLCEISQLRMRLLSVVRESCTSTLQGNTLSSNSLYIIDWSPENSKPTTGESYWRGVAKGWPPGYFEQTMGSCADDPIKRWPQGDCGDGN